MQVLIRTRKQALPGTANTNSGSANTSNTDTFRVTYDFNYDNRVEVREVKAGAYAPEIDIPESRDGYYFIGWYENKEEKDLKNAVPFDLKNTAINQDKTIYAIWIDTVNHHAAFCGTTK